MHTGKRRSEETRKRISEVTRGRNPSNKGKYSAQCGKGHPMSGKNLRINLDGTRACRACFCEYARECRSRKSGQSSFSRSQRDHCCNGHEYKITGWYVFPSGARVCAECKRNTAGRYRNKISERARAGLESNVPLQPTNTEPNADGLESGREIPQHTLMEV